MVQSRSSALCFNDFEQLREVVPGTRREIIQIEPGQLKGVMLHANIGDLPIDAVSFSHGVRSIGAYPKGRITLGLLMASSRQATHSSFATMPGDVTVTPPGGEQENRYFGETSLFVTSISLNELEARYGFEDALAAVDYSRRSQYVGDGSLIPRIRGLLQHLQHNSASISEEAAAFWSKAVIDAMLSQIIRTDAYQPTGPLPSALRIVRSVDDLLNANSKRAVHISEICQTLSVSRRTLHRAFHDVVGVGPIAYLRFKRMCALHSILRAYRSRRRTIESLALEFGFAHPGRFAQYYKAQFGLSPIETRQEAGRQWQR